MEDFIDVQINGKSETLNAGCTLSDAIAQCNVREPFAVAVNRVLVTKANYKEHKLKKGDVIDIVYPMQGG
ncbi:sulfur carrier protein ThiS [Anaplasma phagocytophilum]|uniref:Thiamine biosynthesis protein ThiS n=6 Tax=Anaplasma phagocytophilum TaxID=948 RepID=Q2GLP9_ANAPZ|nr:sulfur carrier protein ThiS [Anaplasma phagocytophilum]KJZ99419.1 thiamine biosynthesis protein ThiS [Anaplasma phagocytophilum str. CR1007]ABD43651.1 thiamine biosynthesis protein ThiS [Anaplasma phagocytophilum str. HZ]AGR78581.1 thiamine biosynthesis protein ThiS [Anaplasma phagocytophilum str. HZ2]AGR79828.1 thiamine biosynthesis protein ThiS [Anaplasma phagocytophilum str. JM]AGR81084.1 thiamine biosynthesis protein ThiS [Anaplasma phagocytophilum str. Dog2]